MANIYPSKIRSKKKKFELKFIRLILVDYPFHVDAEGWPEPVYAPPYPFEYYYDNGRNPQRIQPTSDVNFTRPLTIRRHTSGSTDRNLPQLSSRSLSPPTN